MIRKIVIPILVGVLCSTSIVWAQLSFDSYALEHINLIDVNTQNVLKDFTIVIKGDKIQELLPAADYRSNDSIQSFNLTGKYVLPGLIDAHVHFATDPSKERRDEAEQILEAMLLSGVTAVRDMAGDARALASLSRDALVGDIDAPNIYYSALMAGPDFFKDPRTIASAQGGKSGAMPYMRAINAKTNIPLAVAQAKGTGAAGIKLYALLPMEDITRIIQEATDQGIPAWAHAALIPTKPSQVIRSGVISVSHASMLVMEKYPDRRKVPASWTKKDRSDNFWDQEYEKLGINNLLVQMKESDVVLDATLSLKAVFIDNPNYHWRYQMSRRITRDANRLGVKVAAGCDSDQKTFVQHEMKLLVEDCGFTPMEAIVAATKHSAQATGILKTQGTLEIGKMANVLVLDSNPIDDINNLDQVHMVIKDGKIYN